VKSLQDLDHELLAEKAKQQSSTDADKAPESANGNGVIPN
jgi:hypothetical protein